MTNSNLRDQISQIIHITLHLASHTEREAAVRAADAILALTASPAQGEWISVPHWLNDLFNRTSPCPTCGKIRIEEKSAMLAAAPVAPSPGEWIEREALEWISSGRSSVTECALIARTALAATGTTPFIDQSEWIRREDAARLAEDMILYTGWDIATAIRALELPSTPKPQELAGER